MKFLLEPEKKKLLQEKKRLKECVFNRIESENVFPKSKIYFKGRECLIWMLWLLSVILGAFAVAVTIFVFTYQHYALHEATHENLLMYLEDTLPYLWLVVFSLMAYIAFYNLRKTNKGYRYPLWALMFSSVFLSLVGGLTLQIFSFGHLIDNMMDAHMPAYLSQNRLERKMWQYPEDGRLVGRQVFSTLSPTTTIIFEDISGFRWQMNVTELPIKELEMLASGKTVKLLGKPLGQVNPSFHACFVSFWIEDKNTIVEEKSEDRKFFIEKLSEFAQKFDRDDGKDGFITMSISGSSSKKNISNENICGKILPLKKIVPEVDQN